MMSPGSSRSAETLERRSGRFPALGRGKLPGVPRWRVTLPRMEQARILLVDNDADIVSVVSLVLERAGAEVLTASRGEVGLARVREAQAAGRGLDLVVLDLRMPGMSGMEVLDALHALDHAPPVVVLSGYFDDGDRARLEASPLLAGILKKPFDLNTLVETARRAVRRDVAGAGGDSRQRQEFRDPGQGSLFEGVEDRGDGFA